MKKSLINTNSMTTNKPSGTFIELPRKKEIKITTIPSSIQTTNPNLYELKSQTE